MCLISCKTNKVKLDAVSSECEGSIQWLSSQNMKGRVTSIWIGEWVNMTVYVVVKTRKSAI